MEIVFFGSSNFAVPSLEALSESKHKIICVVTQPDRRGGRGLLRSSTAIKTIALSKGLRVYQPDNINDPQSIKFLQRFCPDLFIVISYGQILSSSILNIPKIFSVNLHASLLPKYRGAAPINRAIINGETLTGITIIKMNERMDAGEIILQKRVDIEPADTEITLQEKLAKEGPDLLSECLNKIEEGSLSLLKQDVTLVSFAPKLNKNDGLIDWQKEGVKIQNLIRGIEGWPVAFTYYKGKILKIYKATVFSTSDNRLAGQPGEVVKVAKEGILVAAGKDNLLIEELQLEGGRRMNVEEFICGHKISIGEILGGKQL